MGNEADSAWGGSLSPGVPLKGPWAAPLASRHGAPAACRRPKTAHLKVSSPASYVKRGCESALSGRLAGCPTVIGPRRVRAIFLGPHSKKRHTRCTYAGLRPIMQRSVPQGGAVGPCMSALKRGVSWQPWGIPPSRVGCRPKRTFMRTRGGVGKPGSRIRHPTLEEGKNGVHGKWAVVQTYPCLSRKYTCHSYHPPSPAYTREMEGGSSNLAVSCHGCHLAGSRIA